MASSTTRRRSSNAPAVDRAAPSFFSGLRSLLETTKFEVASFVTSLTGQSTHSEPAMQPKKRKIDSAPPLRKKKRRKVSERDDSCHVDLTLDSYPDLPSLAQERVSNEELPFDKVYIHPESTPHRNPSPIQHPVAEQRHSSRKRSASPHLPELSPAKTEIQRQADAERIRQLEQEVETLKHRLEESSKALHGTTLTRTPALPSHSPSAEPERHTSKIPREASRAVSTNPVQRPVPPPPIPPPLPPVPPASDPVRLLASARSRLKATPPKSTQQKTRPLFTTDDPAAPKMDIGRMFAEMQGVKLRKVGQLDKQSMPEPKQSQAAIDVHALLATARRRRTLSISVEAPDLSLSTSTTTNYSLKSTASHPILIKDDEFDDIIPPISTVSISHRMYDHDLRSDISSLLNEATSYTSFGARKRDASALVATGLSPLEGAEGTAGKEWSKERFGWKLRNVA